MQTCKALPSFPRIPLPHRSGRSVKEILEGKNRELAGETARPEGLTLVEIRYPEWEAKKDGHLVSLDPLSQKDDCDSD